MKVTIVPATTGILLPILQNLRASDLQEIGAALPDDVNAIAARCMFGPAWCVMHGGQPAAAIGYMKRSICVVEAWAFGTDRFTRIAPELTRFIREDLRAEWLEHGVRVVEVRSIEFNKGAHHWLLSLGFRHRAELFNQGKDGEMFHLFTWDLLREDYA